MLKTENSSEGGGPEVVPIYRRQIKGGSTSSTTFVRLQFSVSLNRDPVESSMELDSLDAVDDADEGEDGTGLLKGIRY